MSDTLQRLVSGIVIPDVRILEDEASVDQLFDGLKKELRRFHQEYEDMKYIAIRAAEFIGKITVELDRFITVWRARYKDSPNRETEDLIRRLISDKLRLLQAVEELDQLYEPWKGVRVETIARMEKLACKLDSVQGNVNQAKLASAAGGLTAGALGLGGILAPASGGASLAVTSIGVGVLSGSAGFATQIFLNVEERKALDELKETLRQDEEQTTAILRRISRTNQLVRNTEEICQMLNVRIAALENETPGSQCMYIDMQAIITTGLSCTKLFGALVTRIDDLLAPTLGIEAARTAGKTAGCAMIGIGMAIDLIELIYTAKDMSNGSKSQLALRIREDIISVLQAELHAMGLLNENMFAERQLAARIANE